MWRSDQKSRFIKTNQARFSERTCKWLLWFIEREGLGKNKQFSDSDHNQPCCLEKRKNTNSRKTEKWGNQVISLVLRHYSKKTLIQRDGFPMIQLSNESQSVFLNQFLPNSSSVFFSIHHESTQAFSIKRWEIRFKEIINSKIFFGQKLSKDKTLFDSLESCFLKLLSQMQLSR